MSLDSFIISAVESGTSTQQHQLGTILRRRSQISALVKWMDRK